MFGLGAAAVWRTGQTDGCGSGGERGCSRFCRPAELRPRPALDSDPGGLGRVLTPLHSTCSRSVLELPRWPRPAEHRALSWARGGDSTRGRGEVLAKPTQERGPGWAGRQALAVAKVQPALTVPLQWPALPEQLVWRRCARVTGARPQRREWGAAGCGRGVACVGRGGLLGWRLFSAALARPPRLLPAVPSERLASLGGRLVCVAVSACLAR